MFYFGIDVSRDKLDCAVVDEQGQRIKRARTFANDTQGVNELIGWARVAACEQPCCFVMEATAASHELAATPAALRRTGCLGRESCAGPQPGQGLGHAQQDRHD